VTNPGIVKKILEMYLKIYTFWFCTVFSTIQNLFLQFFNYYLSSFSKRNMIFSKKSVEIFHCFFIYNEINPRCSLIRNIEADILKHFKKKRIFRAKNKGGDKYYFAQRIRSCTLLCSFYDMLSFSFGYSWNWFMGFR